MVLGYITAEHEEGYLVDHLHRLEQNMNNRWAYPLKEDKQIAHKDHLLECEVLGDGMLEIQEMQDLSSKIF